MKKISAFYWLLIGFVMMLSTAGTPPVPGELVLSQTSEWGIVGTVHTVKAHIIDNLNIISPGHVVHIYITGPNNNGPTGTATTDLNDDAFYTYTGTGGVGTDEISGTTIYGPVLIGSTNTLSFQWILDGTPLPSLSEWGLIILGLALVGFGTFYILKLRA